MKPKTVKQHRKNNELFERGLALQCKGEFAEAGKCYLEIIASDPKSFDALHMLGVLGYQMDNSNLSVQFLLKAIELNSNNARVYYNLGAALKKLNRFGDALNCYDRAIELNKTFAEAHFNRGFILALMMQIEAALSSYETAIRLDASLIQVHWNKALVLLLKGDYENGWPLYEWGWRASQRGAVREFSQVLWTGAEGLKGKSILLHAEQGFGDTIQFCRYTQLVAELGAQVVLEVPAPLRQLLTGLSGVAEIIEAGSALPITDYHCPLMSLPLAFKTRLSNVPFSAAYLVADSSKKHMWRQRLAHVRGLKIGLVWNGGFRPNQPEVWDLNERRNIPLVMFSQAFNAVPVNFYSLQKGDPAESEIRGHENAFWPLKNLSNFSAELTDFSDTAALIANLDLVISVDTSTAHLSAALGVPTWILNRFDHCWRWLLNREDSPWYDTVKLYRQGPERQWEPVLVQVAKDLLALQRAT